MTIDEATGEICALTPLSAEDVEGLAACSADDLVAIVQSYRDSNAVSDPSTWQRVIEILKDCEELAGVAVPLFQAAQFVFSL